MLLSCCFPGSAGVGIVQSIPKRNLQFIGKAGATLGLLVLAGLS